MSDEAMPVKSVRSVRLYLHHSGGRLRATSAWESIDRPSRALPLCVLRPRQGWDIFYIRCPICRQQVGIYVGSVGQILLRAAGKLTAMSLLLIGGLYLMRIVGDTDLGQCLLAGGELMWIWTIARLFPEHAISIEDAHTQHTVERA